MATAGAAPAFWPFAADGLADPYPAYAAQRALDPVCPVPGQQMYVVTRHSYVRALLRNQASSAVRLASAEEMGRGHAELGTPLERTLNRMAAFSDAPRHQHVRRPLQEALRPPVVAPLRERYAALAREYVAAVDAQRDEDGAVEVMTALVEPLANAVMADMMRLPAAAPPAIREMWSQASVSADGLGAGVTEDSPRRLAEIHAYLGALLSAVREQPGEDPLGVLVKTAAEDPELTDADLVANLIFVINSGHRAMAQAFGLFIHTLATDPAAYDAPVADMVEALLRHDTSVQFTSRRMTEDVELDGRTLEAGHLAVLMLGAANRDPEAPAHVAFGYGPHFCAGAAVSRIILQEALAALLERAPKLTPVDPPTWSTFRPNMRGCERLRLLW